MGVLDKFLDVMKLSADDDEDFYDEDYYDDDEDEEPVRKHVFRKRADDDEDDIFNDKPERNVAKSTAKPASSKVTPIRKRPSSGGMEVCVIKPTSVDDGREITETLLDGRTVILNLEGLDVDIAQRIIDFSSGSCYAINGNLQKVSNYIFVITPQNVEISGDILNLMDAFDSRSIQADF